MKSETLPAPTLSSEAHWVQGELVRSLMRTQRQAQWLSLLLMAVIVGVLWGDVSVGLMSLRVALGLALAAWRWWVLRRYEREVLDLGADAHVACHRRPRAVW